MKTNEEYLPGELHLYKPDKPVKEKRPRSRADQIQHRNGLFRQFLIILFTERNYFTMSNPIVTILMEDGGVIKAELYPETAPNTVHNFISLVKKGFYDATIFHRVIPGFMIQGGDPEGTGMGGPGYSIRGEFSKNGFQNDLRHTRGVLSMARSNFPDSAGSQFFIMVDNASYLDGQYAAFGKVIEGMEVADKIVNAPRDRSDRPKTVQRMKSVTVETFGVEYPEPEKA